MSKVIERCAGIDIGKRFLLCCALTGAAAEEPQSETLRFEATVAALREWLASKKVTHVIMESTGSYWIPVFNILEDHFVIVLANPEEVKNRKGHKTDRKDAEHLADLLRHDHVRASYIPPKPVRDLRDLTRRRLQLTADATRERNRVQKLLEHVNVKIGNVLSDVFGVSGQNMLSALLSGEATPEQIAQLARGQAKRKIPQLIEALEGHRMGEHERLLIRSCLRHLACLEEEIEEWDVEILRRMQMPPFETAYRLLQTLPGVGQLAAASILAETGTGLTPFPTAGQMASWAGLCPGNRESAGIRKGSQTTHGNSYLRTALVQCAWAATRKQGSVFQARFQQTARAEAGHRGRSAPDVDHRVLHVKAGSAFSRCRERASPAAAESPGPSSPPLSASSRSVRWSRSRLQRSGWRDRLRLFSEQPEGVVLLGKAQEKTPVFRTEKRRNPETGQSYPWIVRSTAMINHYYWYCPDRDFGPFFLKFASYFPYNAKLCLNGHEYAKCQLRRENIGFKALDNGFVSCENPERLQTICEELGPPQIDGLPRRWLSRLPHPFTAADREAGYRYDLSILRAEFSLTQILDRPLHGPILLEEIIRENLDIGRPDRVQLLFDRRVTKRTPGRFRTRVRTDGVIPSLHVDYKNSRIKQYFKQVPDVPEVGARTETTINNTRDFSIGKRLCNLPACGRSAFKPTDVCSKSNASAMTARGEKKRSIS